MRDPFAGYDAWLEKPYQDRARDEAAFEDWCENNDVAFTDPGAWDKYEAAREDAADYAAESKAEAMRDEEPPPGWGPQ